MFRFIITFLCFTIHLSDVSEALPYRVNNDFIPNAFPARYDTRVFSMPVDDNSLIIVYPAAVKDSVEVMASLTKEACGHSLPFRSADEITGEEIASKHLVIIGNIADNNRYLALYKRRFAFADAYFPGPGGVIIHPAQSVWNREKNVIVIGISREEDVMKGFRVFARLLKDNSANLGPLHYLETDLALPTPPESVKATLDAAFDNPETAMAPYWTVANWGLLYFLTGDQGWAEHFRDGMRMCYDRAAKNGRWVTESWTNLYFNHWKLVYVWELIDDDPFFTDADRKIIEETLWGYTKFVDWLPNLDPDNAPLHECRQNHTTFLALSLFYSYRYYTEKYGLSGLDHLMDKVTRCFDDGQASSYRPNDDAGGYLYLAPVHMLTYDMAKGDDSYFTSGKFARLADLVAATIDNRRDPVSFGDVGGYSHRVKGSPRGRELQFLSMAAWKYGDGQYQWLYNWGAEDSAISLDTMKESSGTENPIQMHFGADRVFTVEDMYTGMYTVEREAEQPRRFLGVFPIILDDAALTWSAKRTENPCHLPQTGKQYADKISFRRNFNPEDEYLLLDGLSTFSHGHLDGNTVSRLTWKDRIWLFDLDYIKMSPKYHNGVTITHNGVQDDPPPLTILESAADFDRFGFSITTSPDYNGVDWTRSIIWRKGKYFLFLDRIIAREAGYYRIEGRWRTRGETTLDRNRLTVRQGDAFFHIKSADTAPRRLYFEQDGSRSKWNYPYGNGWTAICVSRKDIALSPSEQWVFANMMYAVDGKEELAKELSRIDDNLFLVDDADNQELIGLSATILEDEGVSTDCALFVQDSRTIWLINATRLVFSDASITAPGPVNIEINYRQKTGRLIVPEGSTGNFRIKNIQLGDMNSRKGEWKDSVSLGSGTYTFEFNFTFLNDFWKNRVPFIALKSGAEQVVPSTVGERERSFGIDIIDRYVPGGTLTAVCGDGHSIVAADSTGRIFRCHEGLIDDITTVPSGKSVICLCTGDCDGDGVTEIVAGDSAENLYCFASDGGLKWSHKLMKYYGTDANAADITFADIDNSGNKTILVSTAGWNLYAIKPDGTVRWNGFTYYHPQTMARVYTKRNGEQFVAVGTEYHTPLNVLSPDDGSVRWHVWEEMGSEYLVTTDYCGYHLTAMAFLPAGKKWKDMIVFSTKANTVHALDPATGATFWRVNIGGEATALELLDDENEPLFVAGSDGGDIALMAPDGAVRKRLALTSGITGIVSIHADKGRREFVVGTEDGRILVLDDTLRIRAVSTTGGPAVVKIIPHGVEYKAYHFSVATAKGVQMLTYKPYYLKKSRHY